MSGQFPDRVPPGGPFTETTDDAALGGTGFVRWANMEDSALIVEGDAAEFELDMVFNYPSPDAIPCVEGSVFEVDLSAVSFSDGLTEEGALVTLAVGVEGITNAEGSTTISTMTLRMPLTDSEVPVTIARKCMIVAEAGTTELTGLRLVLTTSAEWGVRQVTFYNVSGPQAVVRRVA